MDSFASFHENGPVHHGLPAFAYASEDFYERETKSLFPNNWTFIGFAHELKRSGDVLPVTLAGKPLLMLRDQQGGIRVFHNICRHRCLKLVDAPRNVGRVITCPYHAWAYTLDGRLHAVRNEERIENFDKADFCLMPVKIEAFCDLIFINLDPDATSLKEQAGGLGGEVLSYAPDIANLTHAHRMTYTIKANWKAVVDNFLECYHCPVAHRDFCSLVEMDTYKVTTHGIYSSHMAKAGRADNSAYDVADATVQDHAVWWLWPNMSLMRYPGAGNFMVWQFIPAGPEETYEIFDFFFEKPEPSEAEMEAIRYIDEVLQQEDIGLCESVQRGMRTPAFERGRFMADPGGSGMSEHGVHHFHGLLLDAYERMAG